MMHFTNLSRFTKAVRPPVQPRSEFFSWHDALDRQHAIREGFLVDVSSLAVSFFDVPVALTRNVWDLCVAMDWREQFIQQWRICSIVCQARVAAQHAAPGSIEAHFDVRRHTLGSLRPKIRLWLRIEADRGRPVLTIMTDDERQRFGASS